MFDPSEHFFRDWVIKLSRFLPYKRSTPRIGPESTAQIVGRQHRLLVLFLLFAYALQRVIVNGVQISQTHSQVSKLLPWFRRGHKKALLEIVLIFVDALEFPADFFVVTFDGIKSPVRNTLC